jgi:hypothetical protein
MNKYRFEVLHPYTIIQRWDELLPHIERVVKVSNDEFTPDSIKHKAVAGIALVVAVYEDLDVVAVVTAEVVTYDSGLKSLLVPICGGNGLMEWGLDLQAMLKDMAVALGCVELRGLAVRNGWLRVLRDHGWRENHVVIVLPLGEE